MKYLITISVIAISICCHQQKKAPFKRSALPAVNYDSHVHLMSPTLIKHWQTLGIPFSQTTDKYSNIDTILYYNKAKQIDLIGMGYVYGNPEFYEGTDAQQRLMEENNYLLQIAKKHPNRITPYFAIDPLKKYALRELERCYQLHPKCGVKLHFNVSQVYLTEPTHLTKAKQLLEKSAAYKLPILLHFDNWHPEFGAPDVELLVDSILQKIPPIQLQIAHFGTSGGFNKKTKKFIDAYLLLKNQNRIPNKHTILFDISAVALDKDSEGVPKLTTEAFVELKEYIDKLGIENIVFGTDYPLYQSPQYLQVLKEKVGLTVSELKQITSKQH